MKPALYYGAVASAVATALLIFPALSTAFSPPAAGVRIGAAQHAGLQQPIAPPTTGSRSSLSRAASGIGRDFAGRNAGTRKQPPRMSGSSSATAAPASKDDDDDDDDDDDGIFEPIGAGIRRDFGRRLPLYKSDIVDGLNSQVVATTLFLFFACLAPAIGFGGILDVATSGAMGTIEMVGSTAACGVAYSLLSAQPMQLVGPMGPVLAFTVSVAKLAEVWNLPFLPLYGWVGLWMSGMLFVAALTSASNAVRKLTGFTDEIFSGLISTIFLFEAFAKIGGAFADPAVPSTRALLALLCASFTFGTAIALKGLNASVYFTKAIRKNLSNFAPAIGVLCGSFMARAAKLRYGPDVASLPALSVPATFVTTSGRPWLIPLGDLPTWARWGAALPALLGAVLLFLDQNITARLVNNPRNKMIKGRDEGNVIDGMHGDMLVLSLLTGLASLVGLPWMAGATTRSAAHVRSLLRTDGGGTGDVVGSVENRVSGAAIHALIGACILFPGPRELLTQVPLPVLSGVFLYLGLTSLQGLELWDRVRGLFQDATVAPQARWSGLPRRITSLFTTVQMFCIAGMMAVTKSSFGVVSPLLIALLPALRIFLVKAGIIDKDSMEVLDAEG